MKIPFNKPYTTGKELQYISEAIASGQISGNGPFTKKCHELLVSSYGFSKPLLTSSCTDALEMSALLLDIEPGDEVIVPSYTFVSTALAFKRQGAEIIFADSRNNNPCIDENRIEGLITEKTRAIVPVHYSGIACEMDKILELAEKYNIWVVEDAAHAFGAKYKGRLLGTIGHLGCFSFHETKIIHCGEGGMLSVNDNRFGPRSEILWEKGTNRCEFQRGEVQKYEWMDTGSSFLMSDISAAFLLAQFENSDDIIDRRGRQWNLYFRLLKGLDNRGILKLPQVPDNSEINYSGFYFTVINREKAEKLRTDLNSAGIQVLSHYLDLGHSPYILKAKGGRLFKDNINCTRYQDTLLRLPLYHELRDESIFEISDTIKAFFKNE
jgi:dTDP-4-amino-4,6-dideoxygalactose transaminase